MSKVPLDQLSVLQLSVVQRLRNQLGTTVCAQLADRLGVQLSARAYRVLCAQLLWRQRDRMSRSVAT